MNIKNLGFIHRGFSSVSNHLYRNSPMWHLAIDVKRKLPNIPMLVDPSHICGSRENLEEVSQKACDLNYDGIIIESHRDPTNAWSDAKQQVTPEHLLTILDKLIWKTEKFDSTELSDKLSHHRQQIDQIDNELLMLIAKRMTIAQEIGKYKNKQNVTILQQKRWNEIVQRLQDYGKKLGLSHEFIEVYLQAIHLESIRFQES